MIPKNAAADEFNSFVIKQKQTNKQKRIYMRTEFQNSIVRSSFLCCITDIKIAWINSWQTVSTIYMCHRVSTFLGLSQNSDRIPFPIGLVSEKRFFRQIKHQVEQASCSSCINHGYMNKTFRINHKVRRF